MTEFQDSIPLVPTLLVPSAGEAVSVPLGQPVTVLADAELFAALKSKVVAETVAVFVTVVVGPDKTVYVALTVADDPAVIVPSEQGNDEQAPVAETKLRRDGVGSVSVTPVASDGPLFVTVIV